MDQISPAHRRPRFVGLSTESRSISVGRKLTKKEGVYVVSADGGSPRRISDSEERLAPPFGGAENEDRTRKLFVDDGDIFLLDLRTGNRRQLTQTIATESAPGFTLNPDHVYFTRENNLYRLTLSTGLRAQLTDFRRGPAPKESKLTDSQKFVEQEEKNLIAA
jgi:hypothetical protein